MMRLLLLALIFAGSFCSAQEVASLLSSEQDHALLNRLIANGALDPATADEITLVGVTMSKQLNPFGEWTGRWQKVFVVAREMRGDQCQLTLMDSFGYKLNVRCQDPDGRVSMNQCSTQDRTGRKRRRFACNDERSLYPEFQPSKIPEHPYY